MQKLIVLLCLLCQVSLIQAQTKPASKPLPADPSKLTMEDMQRLSKMSPAEREAYKARILKSAESKLKQTAKGANIKLDETILPSTRVVAPVKDIKRLTSLPASPPTRQMLLSQVAKMETVLKQSIGTVTVNEVEKVAAGSNAKETQGAAMGAWYGDNPQGALLLGLKSVQKEPADFQGWNNLAALFNMAGLEQYAVPMLMHCLEQNPGNATILNNLGQSYLGMGDLSKAGQYFTSCLQADELHPEANHSMAMISMFNNDMEKALEYFEKELKVAQRRSALGQLVKNGHRNRINLGRIRKQKMQLDGTNNRNFFSEIALGKFDVPAPPKKCGDTKKWKAETDEYLKSVSAEFLYWSQNALVSQAELKEEGKRYPGLYADMVDELLSDLGDMYIPLLTIVSDDDVSYLHELQYQYAKKDHETPCPNPPVDPGNTAEVFKAYEKKCCDLKTPLIDELMNTYNSFVWSKIVEAQTAYKEYINAVISTVQMDPSPANNRHVYHMIAGYFTFLSNAVGAYVVLDRPAGCHDEMSIADAERIISSNRDFTLKCPSWLKVQFSVVVASVKADCNAFNIEASGELLHAGAEKSFKTGNSTLYVGAGIKGNFKGWASGSIQQQFYIVFDNNNQFADLGMRGNATGDLAKGGLGVDFNYDFAMNSGFNAQAKVKSNWVSNFEKAVGYVVK